MGLNYGAYIGFNSVWGKVVGLGNRRATPHEVWRMGNLVRAGMAADAFGLSAGLDYKPGFWASADEVVAVSRAAASWRTNFTNHERVFEGNGYSSMAGMRETMAIGERSGLTSVITHAKLQGRDQEKTGPLFALATDARRRDREVGLDAHPYTFGATSLEQFTVPAWAQVGGNNAMLARVKDPALRPRIDCETVAQLDVRWSGAAGVTVVVNGRLAPDAGRATGAAVGRVLARTRHEPTRPMTLAGTRSLRIDGAGPVRGRLEQRAGAARPTGRLRVTMPDGRAFDLAPSILQTAQGWASATGIAVIGDGRPRAVTLIAEAADPFAAGCPSVTVMIDGQTAMEMPLTPGVVRVVQPAR